MTRTAAALVVLSALTLPPALLAQDTEWNRYTLEELGGVMVGPSARESCQSAGVSEASARAVVEAALVEAEVPVLSREEMLETPGHPELRIVIDCVEDDGRVGYVTALRVLQAAQLIRDQQISLPEAVTWHTWSVGVAEEGDLADHVQGDLVVLVERFTEAWAAAHASEETS